MSGARSCLDAVWPALLATAHAGAPPPALAALEAPERALAELYLDFLAPSADGTTVLAHLGLSLDGRIATASGHSTYVTGPANLVHMHRLRALADAVLVGAGTVAQDDPQLTVRHVDGPSPVRVVLDPDRRLHDGHRVFRACPPRTIVLCRATAQDRDALAAARIEPVACAGDGLAPAAVIDHLAAQGLRRLFIEGGGVTVSRFLAAGCLDVLQLCVAPVIIGSGRPALTLPPVGTMDEALRLQPRIVAMGADTLFACRLERRPPGSGR